MNAYLDFNDRDTYFAARAEWRKDYKALSTEIRQTKLLSRKAQSEGLPGKQWQLANMRKMARNMIEVRLDQKAKAGLQRAARLEELDRAVA